MDHYWALYFLILSYACCSFLPANQTAPHKRTCYSQGLFFLNSTHLFESCGLYQKSFYQVMKYTPQPFSLQQVYESPIPFFRDDLFLQGAVEFKGSIYVLTWREQIVLKLNPITLELQGQLIWEKQGWGLTHNTTHMFISDGTHIIYLVDEDLKILDFSRVFNEKGRPLRNINELEYYDGYIYANIYMERKIKKIDYMSGRVVAEFDGLRMMQAQLKQKILKNDEVFNGIAYHQETGNFIFTGKNWGQYYQTKLPENNDDL